MRGNPTDDDIRVALIAAYLARYDAIFDTYGKKLTENTQIFDIFEDALKDIQVDLLRWALQEYARVGVKFPSPGSIRELIRQRQGEEAWERVQLALRIFSYDAEGGFKPICVSAETKIGPKTAALCIKEPFKDGFLLRLRPFDRATTAAIERIGGISAIQTRETPIEFLRKNFIEAVCNFTSNREALAPPSQQECKALLEKLNENR